jgi:hypothetical protein
MTAGDVVMTEHMQRTAKADRLGWMTDQPAKERRRTSIPVSSGQLVVRFAGVVAALGGMLLAGPLQ